MTDRPLRSGRGRFLIDSVNMLYASYEDVVLARTVKSLIKDDRKKTTANARSRPKKQRQKA